MNKHLEPIFNIVLPAIKSEGINYWVYGGVAIAGIKGYYYRFNQDVDIFVFNGDYENAIQIIKNLANKNSWGLKESMLKGIRPKLDLLIDGKKRLSLMPVYENRDEVQFVFEPGSVKFSKELLKPVIHSVEELQFPTPSENLIKELFQYYLKDFLQSNKRWNRKLWDKRRQDTEELLGFEKAKELFSNAPVTDSNQNEAKISWNFKVTRLSLLRLKSEILKSRYARLSDYTPIRASSSNMNLK